MNSLPEGELIAGRYQIQRNLHKGGMGVVYLARDNRFKVRSVALKFASLEDNKKHIDPRRRQRFLQEADALASVRSPNIVSVSDVGEHRLEGQLVPFLVMDYLEGEDLEIRLKRLGTLPVAQAAKFCIQACQGLAEVHARNIIHRDIKPSNIFLQALISGEQATLIDFGIAKVLEQDQEEINAVKTRTGSLIGTQLTMSPEQLTKEHEACPETDIWGIGVTLYRMLYGSWPFDGATVAVIFNNILSAAPKFPKNNEISSPLVDIIKQCLEKKIEGRFRSAMQLAKALAPFLSLDGPPRAVALARSASLDNRTLDPIEEPATAPETTPDSPPSELDSHERLSREEPEDDGRVSSLAIPTVSPSSPDQAPEDDVYTKPPGEDSDDNVYVGNFFQPRIFQSNPPQSPAEHPTQTYRITKTDFPVQTAQPPVSPGTRGAADPLYEAVLEDPSPDAREAPPEPSPVAHEPSPVEGEHSSQEDYTPEEASPTSKQGKAASRLIRINLLRPTNTAQERSKVRLYRSITSGLTPLSLGLFLVLQSVQRLPCEESGEDVCAEQCHLGKASSCLELARRALKESRLDLAYPRALQACRRGLSEGCSLAARLLHTGQGAKDLAERRVLLEKSCEGAHNEASKGCVMLGLVLRTSEGGAPDLPRATAIFERACAAGNQEGCVELASNLLGGVGAPRQAKRAASLLSAACEQHSEQGCYQLATLLRDGKELPRNIVQAERLFLAACDLGHARACENIGDFYYDDDQGPKNAPLALGKLERACALSPPLGCSRAGFIAHSEKGVVPDRERAKRLYQRGCDAGDAHSCGNLGGLMINNPNAKEHRPGFELQASACERGQLWFCTNAASTLLEGKIVDRDPTRARRLLEGACEKKDARACRRLGNALSQGDFGDGEKALSASFLTRACEAGDLEACKNQASGYLYGYGHLTIDTSKATELWKKCCDSGDGGCCVALSRQLDSTDAREAADLARKSCDAGEEAACWDLARFLEQGRGIQPSSEQRFEAQVRACKLRRQPRSNYYSDDRCHELRDKLALECGSSRTSNALYCSALGRLNEEYFASPDQAIQSYRRACNLGDHAACVALGKLLAEKGGTSHLEEATRWFRVECGLGSKEGCSRLIPLLLREGSDENTAAEAKEMLTRTCSPEAPAACALLGFLFDTGRGTQEDPAEALRLYRVSCEAGDPSGCRGLGYLHETGRGTREDLPAAAALYQQACATDPRSCVYLGRMVSQGQGRPRSLEEARRLFFHACQSGDRMGCESRAALLEEECRRGESSSCNEWGLMYRRGELLGDWTGEIQCYELGCARKDSPASCYNQGITLQQRRKPGDLLSARAAFNQSCEGKYASGCYQLARMLRAGEGGDATPKGATVAAKKGCDLGLQESCRFAAELQ